MKALRRYVEVLRNQKLDVPLSITFYYDVDKYGIYINTKYQGVDDTMKIIFLAKVANTLLHFGKNVDVAVEPPPLLKYSKKLMNYARVYAKILKAGFVWIHGFSLLDINRCEVRYVDPDGKIRRKRRASDFDIQVEAVCRLMDENNKAVKEYVSRMIQEIDDLGV